MSNFIDTAFLHLKAGDGGSGASSFRREKFVSKGGPDGGDGGKGGNIIIVSSPKYNSLQAFKHIKKIRSKNGMHGLGKKKHGAKGDDFVIEVPIGTQVFNDQKILIVLRKKITCTLPSWTLVGKDLFVDECDPVKSHMNQHMMFKLRNNIAEWIPNTEVHMLRVGGHTDACFHTCKPGVIVSLMDIQNYNETFPKWDVLGIASENKWWDTLTPFMEAKKITQGKYWIPGEEKNEPLLQFINSWLDEWVGYAEETVFDVNMFMINESTACVSNYNKDVFDFFKKHKIEPIIVPLRHRFFWDGGLHCCSADLVREGDQQSYI